MNKGIKYSGFLIGCVLVASLLYFLLKEKTLPTDKPITRIVVEKSKRKMHVYSANEILKSYPIALGFNPIGHKQFEGDGKTPEGVYTINDKNPNSAYFLNLGISYPNAEDIENAEKAGKAPGGDIKIHGMKNGMPDIGSFHKITDWTLGCIAVSNTQIQELFDNVPIGTEIEIKK